MAGNFAAIHFHHNEVSGILFEGSRMEHFLRFFFAISIVSLVACGGGSSGGAGSSAPTGVSTLVLGSEFIDATNIQDGTVRITFPAADGDQPMITMVLVNGGIVNGFANLPDPNNTAYDITTDGVEVYMPLAGSYTVTVIVSDAGDEPVNKDLTVVIPNTASYPLSGSVEDGPAGGESGVNTRVRLLWHPLSSPSLQVGDMQSDPSSGGSFTFANLIGAVSNFEVRVDGGTD